VSLGSYSVNHQKHKRIPASILDVRAMLWF
jgi:hypothetical protein